MNQDYKVPEFDYIRHFVSKKVLDEGHNTDPESEKDVPKRNLLVSEDKVRIPTKIPNIYKGELQPDFESGNSLPEVYDPKKPIET
jgi:hypothetical protein